MRFWLSASLVFSASVFAFGLPGGTPSVPDVPDVPQLTIPGIEILGTLQEKLDTVILQTAALSEIFPDLSVLDRLSDKLAELQQTDPTEYAGLRSEIEALRSELVSVREEIDGFRATIDREVGEVKTSIDTFMEGLPGAR